VLRCLRSLHDHGYLDRPKAQLATLHDEGPRPFVYGLGQKGARVLREYGSHARERHGCSRRDILAAAPLETRAAQEPLRWEAVSAEHGKRERWSVVPDGVFGLSFPDGTAAYFLLELDRGTIPIFRRGADHRSTRRKLKTYHDGWRAQRHVEQFGLKEMRVLLITSSPERVHNMVGCVRSITEGRGSNFFLFADRASLADPLQAEWTSGKGEHVRLTD
jgi:Replication-relaxation